MKEFISVLLLSSIAIMGLTFGTTSAQVSTGNNTNDTTAALVNLTNASSSLGDAKNMSVIQGTMNQTGP